jgi:YbbR domain-containing protein
VRPRPFLARALFEELPLKVVSLVLALTLFVIVRSDKDAATGAFVKVIYALPTDQVVVSEPPSEVKVGIRGPWTRLSRFDERDLDPIRIDLSKSPQVVHLDDEMVRLPVGLRVGSIYPTEIKLDYEPRVVKEVPVQPLLEGAPQEGFRVGQVTADPPTVRVDGARHVVEQLGRVATRPLRVEGATGHVRGQVALEPAPHLTRYRDATTVNVDVEVQTAIVERTLEPVPIKVTGAVRLEGAVTPAEVSVILRGPSDVVRKVDPASVAVTLDARLEDGRPPAIYAKRLQASGLPPGVAAELRPDTVSLSTRRRHE